MTTTHALFARTLLAGGALALFVACTGDAEATTAQADICDLDRTPQIRKFTWKEDGTPDFGIPVGESTELAVPSRGGAS